jgi:multimeric flavodoxin WrbA
MKKLAVVYHSANGHTEHIASHVAQGAASVAGTQVHVLKAAQLAVAPETLLQYDGVLLGSPTYLGGVSGVFKSFMDATGKMWRSQQLKGKLANRLGSWSGMMAQAGHGSAADDFAAGDIKTARMFGQGFAETLLRLR